MELFRFKLDGVKVLFVCPMGVSTNLVTGVADRAELRDRSDVQLIYSITKDLLGIL